MTESPDPSIIPAALKRYVRDPVAEEYTVEIFEDWHAVLDDHLSELFRSKGSSLSDESVIEDWEKANRESIERRRLYLRDRYGALLPYAFVSANAKMEYLAAEGHQEFQAGSLSEALIEVVQEFVEIISDRSEFER